ncbi:MAG: hypothetical protein M3N08_10500 [Pseudomonadota bacterium]|nr:hypothetical protein [Pseudomonadota bacterium]
MKLINRGRAEKYGAYAKDLTADKGLRKQGFKGTAVAYGSRIATFIAAEALIQAVVGGEAVAGLATGPLAIIVEPLIGLLGLGEEIGGGFGAAKLAGFVGRKVDAWYASRHPTEPVITSQAVPALPTAPTKAPPFRGPSPPKNLG